MAIWGIEEDQIVLTSVAECASEVREGVLAAQLGLDPEHALLADALVDAFGAEALAPIRA